MERDNTNFCLSGKSKPFSNKLRDAATEKKSKDILSKLKPSSGKKDADPSKERPRTAVRQMPAPRARPRPSSATLTKSGHTATAKSRQTCEQRLTVFESLSLRDADCGENVNLLEPSGGLIENWVCKQSCPPWIRSKCPHCQWHLNEQVTSVHNTQRRTLLTCLRPGFGSRR